MSQASHVLLTPGPINLSRRMSIIHETIRSLENI